MGAPPSPSTAVASPAGALQTEVKPADRDRLLGAGWRSSSDLAWSLIGSSEGLHVLTARESEGYHWRLSTTLAETGFDTDQWIGNGCVTGSGRYLVVVYAPRGFTNNPAAFDRAAFSAVVDLLTHA